MYVTLSLDHYIGMYLEHVENNRHRRSYYNSIQTFWPLFGAGLQSGLHVYKHCLIKVSDTCDAQWLQVGRHLHKKFIQAVWFIY